MTNILFIAFEFPPLNRGGVYRPLAFTKYLPLFGINPVVVTLAPESYPDVYHEYSADDSLGKEVIDNATILFAKSGKVTKQSRLGQFISVFFSVHGNETDQWREEFFKVAEAAVRQYNIKAILATVPPFSVLPLATEFAEKTKLPLIFDFRDAWSQWRMVPFGTIAHYWANLRYERKYFKKADAVIATSEQTLADFKQLHSVVPDNKFHYIPNGYGGDIGEWQSFDTSKKEIVIGYVGSFYFEPDVREAMLAPWYTRKGHRMLQYMPQVQDWLYRAPHFFFRALKHLKEHRPEFAARIKVRFVGKIPTWLPSMIAENDLQDSVELLGPMPHAKALEFQRNCDMLLITSAKRLGGKDYSIAGKTFEYIQAQKPILAFVCDGSQRDILEQSGMALICDPDNVAESADKIVEYITTQTTLTPNYDFIKTLSREYQARQLAGIINNVIQEQK